MTNPAGPLPVPTQRSDQKAPADTREEGVLEREQVGSLFSPPLAGVTTEELSLNEVSRHDYGVWGGVVVKLTLTPHTC